MSDAEATVRFAIFNGLVDQWHRKDDPDFVEIAKAKIFDSLFAPHLRWALEEYLLELNNKSIEIP